jgi:hypothetical protein
MELAEIEEWWLEKAWAASAIAAEGDGQHALARVVVAKKRPGVRNRDGERLLDRRRPEHLRRNRAVAGIERPEWLEGRLPSVAPP